MKTSLQDNKIYVFKTQMSFLGKIAGSINNTISNTLTGIPANNNNNRQVADPAQSKRRDKIIKQFEAQIKKLREDNDFINKAYQQLQVEHQHAKQNYNNLEKIVKQSLQQVSNTTVGLEKQLKQQVIKSIYDQLESQLGEAVDGDLQDQKEKVLNFQLKLDCTRYLQQQYSIIIEQFREDLSTLNNKQALQDLGRLQEQVKSNEAIFKQQMDKAEKQYKNKVSELSSVMINNQEQYEHKIRDMKENSDIITTELKNMLAKEKENFLRVDKELSNSKLAQDKYQKQIFNKCEQNNALVSKNKELISEVQRLKAEYQQQQAKVRSLQLQIEQIKMTLQTKVSEPQPKSDQGNTEQDTAKQLKEQMNSLNFKNAQFQQLKIKHNQKFSNTKSSLRNISSEIQQIKAQLTKFKDALSLQQLSNSSDNLQQNIKQLVISIERQKHMEVALQIETIFQESYPKFQMEELKQKIYRSENIIEQINPKLSAIKQTISTRKQNQAQKYEQVKNQLQSKHKQLDSLKQKLSQAQSQVSNLKNQLDDNLKQYSEDETKLRSVEQQNVNLQNRLLQLQSKSANYIQDLQGKNTQINQLQTNLGQLRQKIRLLEDTKFTTQKDITQSQHNQQKQQKVKQHVQPDSQAIKLLHSKIEELQKHIQQVKLAADKQKQIAQQVKLELQQNLSRVSAELQVRIKQISTLREKSQPLIEKGNNQITSQADANRQVELQQQVKDLEIKLKDIQNQLLDSLNKQKNQSQQISNLQSIKQELQGQKHSLATQVKNKQNKLEQEIKKCNNIQVTLQKLQSELDQKNKKYSSLLQTKSALESQIIELKNNTVQTKINTDLLAQKYESEKKQYIEAQARMRSDAQILQDRYSKLELQNQQHLNKIGSLQNQLDDMEKYRQNLQSQIKNLTAQKEQMKTDIDMMKQMTNSFDQQYLELEKLKGTQSQFKRIQSKFETQLNLTLSEDGIQKLKLQKEELEGKIAQLERSVAEHALKIPELQILRSTSAEAKHSLNMQIDLLNEEVIYKNNLLAEQQEKFALMVQEYQAEKSLKNQELEEINKKNTELQNDLNYLKQKSANLENQINQNRQIIQSKTAEVLAKQKQYTAMKTKKEQIEQNSKKQISSLKNKCNKLENQFSEGANSQRELKDKISKLESTINQYKKSEAQWLKNKDNFNQRQIAKQEDITNMRAEMEKLIVETADKLKKEKQTFMKEMSDRQLIFKSEKNEIQRKYANQIQKLKTEIVKRQMKNLEIENQSKSLKNKLTEQKKATVLLNAKIEEMKGEHAKIDSMEAQNLDLKKKLLMKEEELKKVHVNITNLKLTIEQLQVGIETYRAYAQQKNREMDQITARFKQVQLRYKMLQQESATFKQKLSYEYQTGEDEQKKEGIEKKGIQRRDIVLPIKRLILKYFDAGATYEQKANILSTLSQILELDKKQGEVLKRYRMTKLAPNQFGARDSANKKQPGIQNKFFEFLTSDK